MATGVRSDWADLPEAASPIVKQAAEEAGTVESRQGAPVDAAVDTDKGDRATVPDDAVIPDREIAVLAEQPTRYLAAPGGRIRGLQSPPSLGPYLRLGQDASS